MKRSQKTINQRVKREKFLSTPFPELKPLNENQAKLLEALRYTSLVVARGSAGTGKTLLACWHAAKALHNHKINRIVLLRAYQPLAGRTIGFTPGDANEKLKPYYQQMLDYLEYDLVKGKVEADIKSGTIEICSLETIRGRSWDKTCIIVDESQNLFIPEVQALVTRLGADSQMIFCGDDSGHQTDVKNGLNGLSYLKALVHKYNIDDTADVTFTRDDIVRSDLTREFVIAFEEEAQTSTPIVPLSEINNQFKKGR